jgi:hypothetical protein
VVGFLLDAGCFALASVSHRLIMQVVLGWLGLGVVVLYVRWLLKNKIRGPRP